MKVSLWTIWLALGVAGMISCADSAVGDNAQNTFYNRFGKDLERVSQTPDESDDIELSKTLLDAAQTAPENPESLTLLCENAYMLGSKNPESYHIAIEAMELLKDNVPELRTKCLEKILVLQMDTYGAAVRRDKVVTGEDVVYTLLELSDTKARSGNASGAKLFLHQAGKIAKTIQSDIIQAVNEKEKTLPARIRTGLRLQKQLAKLQANPDNIKLRRKLIRQLVVREENLTAAKSLLTPDIDEELRSYVPITLKNPSSLNPGVAYEMSQWYRSLLSNTPARNKAPLLIRIRQYLNVYLMKHTTNDQQRLDAAREFHDVELQLVKLGILPGKKYWSLEVIALGLIADPNVNTAIIRARNYLWSLQLPDGTWPENLSDAESPKKYATPLIAFALIQSGVHPSDKRLVRTLKTLAATETNDTLSLAMRCCLWDAVNFMSPGKYITELRKDTLKLARGDVDGGFGKTCSSNRSARNNDSLHTQYAILGIAMGARGGVKIPRGFWVKSMNWWRNTQNSNGGWGRTPMGRSRRNPTAAGAVSMLICLNQLNRPQKTAMNHDSVKDALGWLNGHLDDAKNLDPTNYFYVLSRLGVACKTKLFGKTNWFKLASNDLLLHQQNDGAWKPKNKSEHTSTAFGILVLCTARGGR